MSLDPEDRGPGLGPNSPATASRYIAIGAVVAAVVIIGMLLFTGGREPTPSTASLPGTDAPAIPVTPRAGNAGPGTTR